MSGCEWEIITKPSLSLGAFRVIWNFQKISKEDIKMEDIIQAKLFLSHALLMTSKEKMLKRLIQANHLLSVALNVTGESEKISNLLGSSELVSKAVVDASPKEDEVVKLLENVDAQLAAAITQIRGIKSKVGPCKSVEEVDGANKIEKPCVNHGQRSPGLSKGQDDFPKGLAGLLKRQRDFWQDGPVVIIRPTEVNQGRI